MKDNLASVDKLVELKMKVNRLTLISQIKSVTVRNQTARKTKKYLRSVKTFRHARSVFIFKGLANSRPSG